jgi:hypothetical protein
VNEKVEKLNKAIEKYNLENESLAKVKKNYEDLLKKAKLE